MTVFRSGIRVSAAVFALGLSVVGPQAIAAADRGTADTSTGPVSSSSIDSSPAAVPQATRHRGARTAGRTTANAAAAQRSNAGVTVPRSAAAIAVRTVRTTAGVRTPNVRQAAVQAVPSAADATASAAADPQPLSETIDGTGRVSLLDALKSALVGIDYRIDNAVYGFLDAAQNCLSMLPSNPITDFLQGSLLLIRRTFFDQAPILNPVQLTGQVSGAITGTLGGKDPEAEAITYSLVDAPSDGTVLINPDGTWVYTPGADFTGTDAFVVSATDLQSANPLQGNWIDCSRPDNTDGFVWVTQTAVPSPRITFNFTPYDAGAQSAWVHEPASLPTLQLSAFNLGKALNPKYSVTLNYAYKVETDRDYLGFMQSSSTTDGHAGFWMTTAQAKITQNLDPTGAELDGILTLNLDHLAYKDAKGEFHKASWNYVNSAPLKASEYNFQSVATHELLHSLAFTSFVNQPGCNAVVCFGGTPTDTPKTEWEYFDQFIGDAAGTTAINPTDKHWSADPFDTDLIEGDWQNGLQFVGANARATFGGFTVPINSPAEYTPGTSVVHLSDYYFDNPDFTALDGLKVMNPSFKAGVTVPVKLSSVEIGILKDLGYQMNPSTPSPL